MKSAILCEGKTDKAFLELLLDNLELDSTNINFFILGNKSNFFKTDNTKYRELLNELELEKINADKVLLMIDADNVENDATYGGCENTQNQLDEIITELNIPNAVTYITCDPSTNTGYLESLILSTLNDKQKACIANFLECSEFRDKEHHKAIVNQIYTIAYPNDNYNFSHPNFNELKHKLQDLFNE